jgi:cytochrome c oxidase subunit II
MAAIWLVLSLIAIPLIIWVYGPHMPPGNVSIQARDQRLTNILLAASGAPVVIGVVVYFAYVLTKFRQRGDTLLEGPYVKGEPTIQRIWLIGVTLLVLIAAGWGTIGLFGVAAGAGGGQGPAPLAQPSGQRLPIQVIAQQWGFTYRYPTYGGVETYTLAVPVKTSVEFHVTSLDVVHSFWAYQLGVKADAVPGADNVAFTKAADLGTFQIRCSELCGLWHGQMAAKGQVLSKQGFRRWIAQQQRTEAPVTKYLPHYNVVYFPDPPGRAG